MSKNYADALRRKPPPVPQPSRAERNGAASKESGAKRPRQEDEFPPLSATVEPSPSSPPRPSARASVRGKADPVRSKTKPPTAILKRTPKEEPSAPVAAVVKKPSSQQKLKNKPRPTKQMSLGDAIPDRVIPRTKKQPRVVPPSPPSKPQAPQPMEVTSHEEFPSLSAAVGAAVPSKPKPPPLPAHAGWGKQPNKKAKIQAEQAQKKAAKPKAKQRATAKSHVATTSTSSKEETTTKKPSLLDFGAKPRTDVGGEHDLIRLLHDGKVQQQSQPRTGRQRVAPRKKKFTTLKKKVLQERLEAWRKLHPENENTAESQSSKATTSDTATATRTLPSGPNVSTCTVCLKDFATSDEVQDDDEYEEIVDNFKEMAVKVGPIRDAFLLRQTTATATSGSCPAFVWFESPHSAAAASACWKGMTVGGERLEPVLLYPQLEWNGESPADEQRKQWRDKVLSIYSMGTDHAANLTNLMTVVTLRNALTDEDYDDTEHLEESLSFIRSLVEQHGTISNFEVKHIDSEVVVFATYANENIAREAAMKLDGVLVGGVAISATRSTAVASSQQHVLKLKNALTEDDLEDEDCLKESLNDIEELAKQHGPLSDTNAIKVVERDIHVSYCGDLSVVKNAAAKLDGTLLGGNVLKASVVSPSGESFLPNDASGGWILLQNLLTEDDIADEEGLEECIEDVKELASRYGKVVNVKFDPKDLTRVIKIEFDGGSNVATAAADKFNGMIIGGQTVAATTLSSGSYKSTSASTAAAAGVTKPADTVPKPLYSGDKLIPERFAECKRVPKVVTSTGPRDYANFVSSEEVKPLLMEMLGELMRLQRRAIEDKNAKARRRLVMGLREVARGIRAHKVKMVVMAHNVDQYGAIDEKLQEILDLAQQEGVPVIFDLNKRKLGKAVGKTIKVSVVGIQNADGAHQQFKKLAALAAKGR